MTEDELPGDGNEHYYALPKGATLHEFEIVSVLGHGGFGITYKAIDTHLREFVAIKEYLPGEIAVRTSESTVRARTTGASSDFEAGLASFLEEARLIAAHRHPRIVDVRRFFKLNGTGYIVMQFESGSTLSQRLAEGPMAPPAAMAVLEGILDGLSHLHDKGILHRDLKPGNVMLRPDGTPLIIDFGAARDFKVRSSRSVTSIATPGYAPPEQYGVGGQQGPWTDLYALGAVAYKMATGITPADSLRRLRKDPLVPAASLAPDGWELAALKTVDWMMSVDEADRPGSARAVRESLSGSGAPASPAVAEGAPAPSEANHPAGGRGSRKWLAAAAVVLLIGGVAGMANHFLTQAPGTEPTKEAPAAAIPAKPVEAKAPESPPPPAKSEQPRQALDPRASGDVIASARKRASDEAQRQVKAENEARETAARANRSYRDRLEAVGYDPGPVKALSEACGADAACRPETRDAINARLVVIAEDDADYAAAQVNVAKLQDYIRTCRVCRHEAAAKALVAAREVGHADRAVAAGHDLAKVEEILSSCRASPSCGQSEVNAIRRRLDLVRSESAAYAAAGNDPVLLKRYADECSACVHKEQALTAARVFGRSSDMRWAAPSPGWSASEADSKLAQAGHDLQKLRELASACQSLCDAQVKAAFLNRLGGMMAKIQDEQDVFRTAGADPERLRRYASGCSFCVHRRAALEAADEVERTRRSFLQGQLDRAGTDEAKLKHIVDTCDAACDPALRRLASERWAAAKAQRERIEIASASPASPAQSRPTSWDHNGSRMTLTANRTERKFTYAVPRDAIARQGVRPGTVLFDGNRNGDAYAGSAYVFKAGCPPLQYWVSGRVAHDQRSVTVRGNTPKRGDGCAVERYAEESLTFTLIGD